MTDWSRDKRAGETEERIAQFWLQGIDFQNLSPISLWIDRNGFLRRTPPQSKQVWTRQTAENNNGNPNNENRDYIVTYPDEQRSEFHEIKAQYRTYGNSRRAGWHTTNFCIEVDAGSIANIECFEKRIEPGRGWFHPGEGTDENGNPYHADWYHHVMPLYSRDGEEIERHSCTYTRQLSDDEITEYLQMVRPGESIITAMPGGIILTLSGRKTQQIIEKYAEPKVVFNVDGPRTDEKVLFRINVKEVIDNEIVSDAYDQQSTITPIFEFTTKEGAERRSVYYMPSILFESISEIESFRTPQELSALADESRDEVLRTLLIWAAVAGGKATFSWAKQNAMKAYWHQDSGKTEMPIDPSDFFYDLPRLPEPSTLTASDLKIYYGRKVDAHTTIRR